MGSTRHKEKGGAVLTRLRHGDNFIVLVGVVEMYGGAYGHEPGLIRAQLLKQRVAAANLDNPDPKELKDAEAICRKEG